MKTKISITRLLLTVGLVCCVHSLSAQENGTGVINRIRLGKGEFSVHAGVALPMGNFKEESNNPGTAFSLGKFSAGPGFTAGLKGVFPMNEKGLGAFVSADFIYNGLKGALKEEWYEEREESSPDRDYTRHRYLNMPLMAGLNYRHGAFWIEGGIGPDFRLISPWGSVGPTYSNDGSESDYFLEYTYKLQIALGFRVGAGIMLTDRYSLGVNYYGLGKAEIKEKTEQEWQYLDGSVKTNSENKTYSKSAQNVLTIKLGYHF